MKKIKLLMLFSILCLMIAIAPAFAMNNDTIIAHENASAMQSDYYFDANAENDDGNGSAYNPYKELDSGRFGDKSTIYLANGNYTLSGSKSYTNLTVIGQNPQETIIKYNNDVGFTSNGLITFKNVTLWGLRVNLNKNSNLIATNVIFKQNSATNSAIYSNSISNVTLENCSFLDNSAKYGGAIKLTNGSLNIKNSFFINNHATYSGGAIACDGVDVCIFDSHFIDDYSISDAGGAIYLRDSELMAKNLELINCSALFGGGITSLSGNLNLTNCYAKSNRAKYYGGAIYKMFSSFELYDSIFMNNSALNGGALYVDNVEDFKISSNYFADNLALSTGGAVYSVLSDSYYDIIDKHLKNSFFNNVAPNDANVYQNYSISMNIASNDYILMHYNSSYDGNLPQKYDLRDFGFVTPVKDQGNGGNCWAFSAISALESSVLKASNVAYDFSEENMKDIASRYSSYGWTMETNRGGYDKMAIGYLTSWLGPVNESEDAYNGELLLSPILNSHIHVQNIVFLKRDNYTDNDAIKKAIMEYGAVSTSVYWSSSYLNKYNYYYYANDSGANHAVAIVGWDDTYKASNFKKTPEGDGAWIIKNSWGSSGDKGFYYVSYYDTRLAQTGRYVSYAFVLNDTVRYDKNYQYDIPGKTDYFLNESATVWYKNKFKATDNEFLAAVSTYFEKDTDWDLFIYVNDTLRLTQSGFATSSYKTIDLNSKIPLNTGDIFEIVFKITVDNEAGVPISEQVSLNAMLFKENISFISYDGKNWQDLYYLDWTYPNHVYYPYQVACIKAFTYLNPIMSSIKLAVENMNDLTSDIVARAYDEYGNLIKYGEVTLYIHGIEKRVSINDGAARLSNVKINDGINNFSAKFNAVGYGDSFNFILVSPVLLNTSISLNLLSQSNPVELKATVIDQYGNPVESGQVTFNMDGVDCIVDVYNGIAAMNYTFKTFGLKNISATFNDLYCYGSSAIQESVIMTNINTAVTLSVDNQFNPVIITADVRDSDGNKVNQGIVTFNVEGVDYKVNVSEGIASLNHVFKVGQQIIRANYFDEKYQYYSSNDMKSIVVSLKSTYLTLNLNSSDKVNNPVEIIATVFDEDGNLVKEGKVTFLFDDGNVEVVPVSDGKASVRHIFKNIGWNNVGVNYIDFTYYDSSSKSIVLNVSKINVTLSLDVEKNVRDVEFKVNFSKPIDEYVTLLINEDVHNVKSNNGTAVLKLYNLTNGWYNIRAYIDSSIYSSNIEASFLEISQIHSTIICDDETFYFNGDLSYGIILKDEAGIPISNYKVSLVIGNVTIDNYTDSLGNSLFKLNLSVGIYDAALYFDGDQYYIKSNSTKSITVKSTVSLPANTKYTYGAKYSVKLLDSKGEALKNTKVNVKVNGIQKEELTTDSNGIINYVIDLNPGSHKITITNPLTGEVKSQNINVVARISGNKPLTMYYGAGSAYKVRVYDDYGNIAKGVKVSFKINGKTYSVNSDSNGYASLKINLNPKSYTITASYKNYKVSNKVVVKPTVVCYDKSVKKSKTFKYSVKLLNTKGKILKYKKVTVKFRGKTYKVKTSSKGIATFKIKAYSKIGKFTLTASYGSAKVSKKITVKK